MSSYRRPWEPREGCGALFPEPGPHPARYPNYKGRIKIRGRTYLLAGWIKPRASGLGEFIVLHCEEMAGAPDAPRRRAAVPESEPF